MKILIFCMVLLMSSSGWSKSKPDLYSGIEFNSRNEFRITLLAKDFKEGLSYNASSFQRPGIGLAPYGAKAYLRDKSGKQISCGLQDGYSSADLSSDLSFGERVFMVLEDGRKFYSPWYKTEDLLRGIKNCANDSNTSNWHEFKIVFSVELPDMYLSMGSNWHEFTNELLLNIM